MHCDRKMNFDVECIIEMEDLPRTIECLLEWAGRGMATSPAAVAALGRAAVDEGVCSPSGIARRHGCSKGTRGGRTRGESSSGGLRGLHCRRGWFLGSHTVETAWLLTVFDVPSGTQGA